MRNQNVGGETGKKTKTLPGAVEFVNYAASQGVEIFYISGRYDSVLPATISALKHFGFPFADAQHIFLQPLSQKVLSKQARRAQISQSHHLVMLLGDQLEDLTEASGTLYSNHKPWVDKHAPLFGKDWIAFPNPVYGKWEDALSDNYRRSTPAGKHQIRLKRLGLQLETSDDLYQSHFLNPLLRWLSERKYCVEVPRHSYGYGSSLRLVFSFS